ncbi:CIC11C00000004874 [Sungouiella intermedia]|uniref:CIC11C00000004874 n=1 Tax=Sungouiella intermedia TaxID=45354 RepID=A0A1L0C3W2_9ASCO|nr:CIC11C00000004874 [[Candida] intermedia]
MWQKGIWVQHSLIRIYLASGNGRDIWKEVLIGHGLECFFLKFVRVLPGVYLGYGRDTYIIWVEVLFAAIGD